MKMFKAWLVGIFVFGVVTGIAGSAWGVPMYINIQGRLTPAPEAIPDEIEFHIYGSEFGGTDLGGYVDLYTGSEVMNADGVFNVNLELRTLEFTADREYWLEIVIDGIGTFSPRQRIVAVPMAITARNLRGGSIVANPSSGRAITAVSSNSYGVYASGNRGVIGFNNDYELDHTGTYGLLGGFPLVAPMTLTVAGTYKYGAYGQADVNNKGYLGYYYHPSVGAATDAGVYGSSASGYGVYGSGNSTARSFKAGVFGTGDYGVHGKGRAAVKGESAVRDGWGAWFINTSADAPTSVSKGVGVYGKSMRGHGIYGKSEGSDKAGIYGEGRFGYGVYGKGPRRLRRGGVVGTTSSSITLPLRNSSFGVYGEAGYGVMGRSDWEFGYGVYGYNSEGVGVKGTSDSSTKAGVYAENTGGGPALQVAGGKIKISRDDVVAGARAPIGHFNIGAADDIVTVRNNYVTPSSTIFLTIQNNYAYPICVQAKRDGEFDVLINRGSGWAVGVEVAYLIIN